MDPSAQPDDALLRRYARERDPEAFAELARRYAGLVYGASLRITGDATDAEDLTQECFLQLAQNAAVVTQSLPGWLHALARSRALNLLRGNARRRRHEERVPSARPALDLPAWEAVSARLDEALAELPDELREPVLRHYLQGQSQAEVAAALGVSQPSVSRRLQEAVEALRTRLERAGIVVAAGALVLCLGERACVPTPRLLAGELVKIGLANVGKAAAVAGLGAKGVLIIAASVVVLGGAAAVYRVVSGPPPAPPPPTVAANSPPPLVPKGDPHVPPPDAPKRIGVYDSRALAVAFAASPPFNAWLANLKKEYDAAKAAGNQKRVAELEAEGRARQNMLHKQGFSTAPVSDILEHLKDQMPALAQAAGVAEFVSKWGQDALAKYPAAERVDVTMALVDALHPNARQRQLAMEIQGHEPLSLEDFGVAAPEGMELTPSKLIENPPGFRPQIECGPGPGVLRALMEFVGEDFGFTTNGNWCQNEAFPLFMGVYGDSFRFVWLPRDGKPAVEGDMAIIDDQPQRFLACLDAAGFSAQAVLKPGLSSLPPPFAWDEPTLRRAIVASVAERKWPVVFMGLPKRGWASIITGYEKGGEVLTGWSVEGGDDRGIRFEPAKRQVFTDWFPKVTQIVLLTGRRARAPEAVVYRIALERAVTEMRAAEFGRFHAGPATFDAWAKQLEDPALSKDDPETVQRRGRILDPMIWDLATRRWYGCLFLKRAAEVLPAGAEELKSASETFKAIHDAVWQINKLGGGKDPGSPLPKLGDAAVRKQIAEIILQCRDRDLEAAKKIEEALRKAP